jgi:hypothetical protein
MRHVALLLALPALLSAQAPVLDEGRLDPAWFGPTAVFQPSKQVGFQWLKTGLDLRRRSIRVRAFEPTAWVLGKRKTKDELLLGRLEPQLVANLAKELRRGLKGNLPVSLSEGDLQLVGRVVDAVGLETDGVSMGRVSLSLDLKLVDGDSGELLAAFHETLEGGDADVLGLQYSRWCEQVGRVLAPAAAPLVDLVDLVDLAAASKSAPVTPAPKPAFDLEGALRRIDGLQRDGLFSEAEAKALKQKAAERSKN